MSELIYAFYSQDISTMRKTFYRIFRLRWAFVLLLISFRIIYTITVLPLWTFKWHFIKFQNISINSLLFEFIYFFSVFAYFPCWEWPILVFIMTIFIFISYLHLFLFCFFLHFHVKFIFHFLVETFWLLISKLYLLYFINTFLVKFDWLKLNLRVWFTITKFIIEKIESFIFFIILIWLRLIFFNLYEFYLTIWSHIWSRCVLL